MKALVKLPLIFVMVIGVLSLSHAQTRKEKQAAQIAAVKKVMEDGNYVFQATLAYSQDGGQHALTSDYDLQVSKDSVVAYLPYYGVAYISTGPGETEGGIKFTSTSFTYSITPRKNGSWDVLIKPKDSNSTSWRGVRQLQLNIWDNGSASLQVISSNRSPIQFDGGITSKGQM